MKPYLIGALAALLLAPSLPALPALGEELTPAQEEAVKKIIDKYLKEEAKSAPPASAPGTPAYAAPPTTTPDEKRRETVGALGQPRTVDKKYGSAMQGSGNLLYSRPFVSSPKAIVGGYMDMEYMNKRHTGPSTFDQRRFVPFIYADVSEHVKMAAELEIEHGIRGGDENEVSLEFATVDYLIAEPFNIRAGIVLLPVGKFNLLHDSPLRDLTERPLVDQFIIPTTLAETGAGFYGTFYPTSLSKLDYEFYVTSGFNGFNSSGTQQITEEKGIKNARQRKSDFNNGFDNNNGKSIVGRVAFSPILGVEVAGSGYYGTYDSRSKRSLSIMALDWTFQRGPFELIGEAAWTYVKDNSKNTTGGGLAIDPKTGRPYPQRMNGYFIQGNYHFLPEWLTRLAPDHFRPEISTFTAVLRWEEVDTNKDSSKGIGQYQRLTGGLNFRPTEDTVFKFDYQYTPETLVKRHGNKVRGRDHGFLASVATYF